MTARRRDARDAVEWRGGVHVAGTPLWCDARRAHEVCFLSSALVPARRHRQIVATQATLEILGLASEATAPRPRRGRATPRALAVPTGRPFALGDHRIELFPTGFAVGSAGLLVEVGGRRVVYAGSVQPRAGRIVAPADARAGDVLVIDASFARFRLPPIATVFEALDAWLDGVRAAGDTPVLLVPPLTNGPDILRRVGPVRVHRAFAALARRLGKLGVDLPPAPLLAGPPAPGEAVLWPPAHREAAPLAALPRARFALVSGWAADPAARARLRVEAGFPLAEQADADDLLAYIGAIGARTVYLLGAGSLELGRVLGERGILARRLGPPEQLDLPVV